jgi:hypothetical protein
MVYGLDDRGYESRLGLRIFLFTTASWPVLGPTRHPSQCVPGALSLGVKRLGREADHSPPSTAEVKECVELYLHSPNVPSLRGAQLKVQRQLYLLHLKYTLNLNLKDSSLSYKHHIYIHVNVEFVIIGVDIQIKLRYNPFALSLCNKWWRQVILEDQYRIRCYLGWKPCKSELLDEHETRKWIEFRI